MPSYRTYGPWTSGGNRAMRLRHDITVGTPAVGASTVAVSLTVTVETRYGWRDNSAHYTRSGALGSTSSTRHLSVATNGSAMLESISGSLPIYADGAHTVAIATTLSGISYLGGATASHTTTVPLPGRVSGLPGRPAPQAVLRSDAEAVISWGATDQADRYYVEQWSEAHQRWTRLGTVHGTSVTDYGLSPNNRYKWRVAAGNAHAESAWAETGGVRTTPNAPRLSVGRADQRVEVAITSAARYPQHWYLERSIDGGSWQYWTQDDGESGVASMVPAPGQMVQFRGRSGVKEGGQRWSAWTATAQVLALTPPNAPTLISPTGTMSVHDSIDLTWRHETRDLTGQTAAEVRWRRVGTSNWTTRSVVTAQHLVVQLATGLWEWQARTKGEHADFGPWSAVHGFRVAPPPQVAITSPTSGATIRSNRLAVTARYQDPGGPAADWTARLLDATGAILETLTGAGEPRSFAFTRTLSNHATYQVWLRVTSSTGLAGEAGPVQVATLFTPPATPTARAEFDEPRGVVVVTASQGDSSPGTPGAASLLVEVSRDGGATWQPLGPAALPSGTVTDPTPRLGGEVSYRVIATSTLPSDATSEPVTVGTHTLRSWLTPDGGEALELGGDLSIQETQRQEMRLETYLGDQRPTPHWGQPKPVRLQIAFRTAPGVGAPRTAWARLLGRRLWFRDPEGRRHRCVIDGDIQHTQTGPAITAWSMTLVVVDE